MKAIKFLKDIFNPEDFQSIRIDEIAVALGDQDVRTLWLQGILEDLKQINVEVDRALSSGPDFKLSDLCARRRAYQDVLEAVLSAKRAKPKEVRHNPLPVEINLDRVTA